MKTTNHHDPLHPEPVLGGEAHPAEEMPMKAKPKTDEYMTTMEAAAYLRRNKNSILSAPDLPYLKGRPNVYSKRDLDEWFERHKVKVVVR